MLGRRKPLLTAVAMLLLLIPTVYEIGVGNLNSMVLLGMILTWRWATRGPEPAAGVVAALLTVVKLTPAALGWWLIVTRKWRAMAAAIVTGVIALGISILGAGLDTHLEYLRILRDPSSMSPSALSLAGMATYVGVPPTVANLLPTAAIVIGLIAIFLLRNRPAWAFGATVLVMIYGSPAVSINWYVLLYALIAPLAWPLAPTESVVPDGVPEGVPAPGTT
jgi:alpha-1,2-mannosyltransferase